MSLMKSSQLTAPKTLARVCTRTPPRPAALTAGEQGESFPSPGSLSGTQTWRAKSSVLNKVPCALSTSLPGWSCHMGSPDTHVPTSPHGRPCPRLPQGLSWGTLPCSSLWAPSQLPPPPLWAHSCHGNGRRRHVGAWLLDLVIWGFRCQPEGNAYPSVGLVGV